MASSTASAGCERAGPPLPPSDPGWRLESGGIRDGPIGRSDLSARRKVSDMTSYDGRSRSKTPSASGCACPPSRKDDHCGSVTLHDRFRARHRLRRISAILGPGHAANAGGAIRKSSPSRTRGLPASLYVHDVVCHGNEQKLPQTGRAGKIRCNFYVFRTDHVRQWHGGKQHASVG